MQLLAGIACGLLLLSTGSAIAAPSLDVRLTDDANEVQWVQVDATAGDFRLSFGSGGPGISETADLAVPATATQVQNALDGLANISAGGGSVSVKAAPGNGTYLVAFDGGPLSHTDVPTLVASAGTELLSGGNGGATILIRTIDPVGVSQSDKQVNFTATVTNAGGDPTSGEVTLEVELPGGLTTSVLAVGGSGWNCERISASEQGPAKAVCRRSDPLSASASFPPVTVAAALGSDTPDRAVAAARASCQCVADPASANDEFTFTPAVPLGVQGAGAGFFAPPGAPFGDPYAQAGGHPFLAVANLLLTAGRKRLTSEGLPLGGYAPTGELKQAIIDLPPGEVANPLAVPETCDGIGLLEECPAGSVVGAIALDAANGSVQGAPLVAIDPEFGKPAQLAFEVLKSRYALSAQLGPENGYATSLELAPITEVGLLDIRIGLCDFGAVVSAGTVVACRDEGDPAANPRPLLTLPTRCEAASPPTTVIRVNSWERPTSFVESAVPQPAMTGCDRVPFEPKAQVAPSSDRADSPTGLDVGLRMPTAGLESGTGIGQANLDGVAIALPAGMSLNPSAADGLGACGQAQIKLRSDEAAECPDSAKIGTVELDTPLLEEPLSGAVYLARQGEVGGATVGLYLVFESEKRGVVVKMPATVSPNLRTGQLELRIDEIPQIPFSALTLHFAPGPRALLVSPPRCGGYGVESEMTPWGGADPGEAVTQRTSYGVTEGPDGGPCPSGALEPELRAGTGDATAGKASALRFQIGRGDGSQRFSGLELTTPPGLTAHLAGIPHCPDAVLASIPSGEETGRTEIAAPACPEASRIGVASLGLGAGPDPLFADTGKVYLAGPYKGAPLSVALVIPAVIGPLDLGNVVVREALRVNPKTAQITLESDPLPTILHGLLLDVRDVRVEIDRPGLVHNPTDCEPLSISAGISGELGARATVSRRFQAEACESLLFRPKVALGLAGASGRNGHPALRATLTEVPGQATAASLSLTLPRSELLAQSHIRAVCTRAQFAAGACPPRSVYGHAEAETPLTDRPLRGPVYLRASDHKLPDLVLALRGPASQPVQVDLVARIDSVGGRIRTAFAALPDVPVTRLALRMRGGSRGLLVNSRNLCARRFRAAVQLIGHNGRRVDRRPLVRSACGGRRR